MKKLIISSVVEFNLKDRVVDVLAKELFDIVRNRGSRFEVTRSVENLDTSVEYLNYQFDRLRNYASRGEIEKFDFLCTRLLKNSRTFLIYSLNHSFPHHPRMKTTKLLGLLLKTRLMCVEESATLHYKRVWIDKKPGDYGRPLGVPELADRMYGHMMTRLMEAYLCGTNQYSDNQHGGVPGKGVMTFLIELAERVKTAPRIFEFDIKGYFDHIDHSVILAMFKSQVLLKYLNGALTCRPTKFILPPKASDKAALRYDNEIDTNHQVNIDWIEFYQDGMRKLPEMYKDLMNTEVPKLDNYGQPTGEKMLTKEFLELKREIYQKNSKHLLFFHDDGRSIEQIFEDDMKNGFQTLLDEKYQEKGLPYTEADRSLGRDEWKDLNLPGKGVPQGSNFGPVVASVILGKVMPENSLLYMDDGLVFAKEQAYKPDEYYNIQKRVRTLGCTLEPKKSRILRTRDLMTEGFKIVGTRWIQSRNYFNYTVSSETRKGLKRKLFPDLKENYLEILCGLYTKGYISASKHKMLRWYLDKGNLKRVRESSLFSVSEKIGIFGNILSKAYSPTVTLEEMKEEIEYGIMKSKIQMLSSEGSLGQRILSYPGKIAIDSTEGKYYVKPSIHNVRAISNDILLRYLKGELPIKSLRVQGLRKPIRDVK